MGNKKTGTPDVKCTTCGETMKKDKEFERHVWLHKLRDFAMTCLKERDEGKLSPGHSDTTSSTSRNTSPVNDPFQEYMRELSCVGAVDFIELPQTGKKHQLGRTAECSKSETQSKEVLTLKDPRTIGKKRDSTLSIEKTIKKRCVRKSSDIENDSACKDKFPSEKSLSSTLKPLDEQRLNEQDHASAVCSECSHVSASEFAGVCHRVNSHRVDIEAVEIRRVLQDGTTGTKEQFPPCETCAECELKFSSRSIFFVHFLTHHSSKLFEDQAEIAKLLLFFNLVDGTKIEKATACLPRHLSQSMMKLST